MSGELSRLPHIRVTDMLEYLRSRGWECHFDPDWQDGFACTIGGGKYSLRQALKTQISADIGRAFERYENQRTERAERVSLVRVSQVPSWLESLAERSEIDHPGATGQ